MASPIVSDSDFYNFLEHFGTHFIKSNGDNQKVRSLSSDFAVLEQKYTYINGELSLEIQALNLSDNNIFIQKIPSFDSMEAGINSYLHQHSYFELMYVLDGIVPVQIENEIYQYQQDDICLINRSVKHIECADSNCSLIFLCIPEKLATEIYTKLVPGIHDTLLEFFKENLRNESSHGKNFIEFRLNTQKTASSFSPQHTLRQMLDELRGQHAGYVSIVQGLLFRFFYYLTEEHSYVTSFFHLDFSQSDYIFDQICSYISQTNGQILRKDLELVLHYNADYLNKIVKKHSGMTLTEYIQSYRIKQAAKLICTTSDPIAKISHSLGFENKAYFYRLFEKYFHMSPLSYRKSRATQVEE